MSKLKVELRSFSDVCNLVCKYNTKHAISLPEILHEKLQKFFYPLINLIIFEEYFDKNIVKEIKKTPFLRMLKIKEINRVNYAVSYYVNNISTNKKNKAFGLEIKKEYEKKKNEYKLMFNVKNENSQMRTFRITKKLYRDALELCDALDSELEHLYFVACETLVWDIRLKNTDTDLFSKSLKTLFQNRPKNLNHSLHVKAPKKHKSV